MRAIKRHWPWLFLIIALGAIITLFDRCRTYHENSQDKHILAAARQYGVDPALVKAVVWRESSFDPRVRGDAGEIGFGVFEEGEGDFVHGGAVEDGTFGVGVVEADVA